MKSVLKIGAFCSARSDISKEHFAYATEFAEGLKERGFALVYGGAQVGLMGHLADECLARGVPVHGVIPHCLNTIEVAHTGLTHLERVEDLFERKRWMMELSDHFVVLPGGVGTLDELLEVITWKVLGQLTGEVLIFNPKGFWNSFVQMIHDLEKAHMLGDETTSQFRVCSTFDEVFSYLDIYKKAVAL